MFRWLSISLQKWIILFSLRRLYFFIWVLVFNITKINLFLLWSLQWFSPFSHKEELFIKIAVFQGLSTLFFNACKFIKINTLTANIYLFRVSTLSFDLAPILFRPYLTDPLIFIFGRSLGKSLILFDLSLNLINNSISLVFVELGYVSLGWKRHKWFNNNLTFTHQIHQFGISIPITLPNRIGNNLIQFFKPSVQSNFHMFWSLRIMLRVYDSLP